MGCSSVGGGVAVVEEEAGGFVVTFSFFTGKVSHEPNNLFTDFTFALGSEGALIFVSCRSESSSK